MDKRNKKIRNLLSVNADSKTVKGQKLGYLTGILYLSPEKSGGTNICVFARECVADCLYTAGRFQVFPAIERARLRKTAQWHTQRGAFLEGVQHGIDALVRKAQRDGLTPCVRLNGTSDIRFENLTTIVQDNKNVQFYDYTKYPTRTWGALPDNYHLTFSHQPSSLPDSLSALAYGANVAVCGKGAMPDTYLGHECVNGDESDLRFLDKPASDGSPVIVWLKAKGKAKKGVFAEPA
jgi:hypothetical protein